MNTTTIQSFNVNADSIQVMTGGKLTVVPRGAANFEALRQALIANPPRLDDALKNLTVDQFIRAWANEPFKIEGSYADGTLRVYFKDDALPQGLNERILQMATNGEDPTPLFNFWERLQRNPSQRSVEQLWPFIKQMGIPLQPDGTFLAYKSVNADLTDKYTSKIKYSVGSVHKMPRNKVSDDPNTACHYGFHVGSRDYAQRIYGSDGDAMIICKVDPEHVVCVPHDHGWQKMRTCEFEVYGFYGADMASTTLSSDDDPNDYGAAEDDLDLDRCPDCDHPWSSHAEEGCIAVDSVEWGAQDGGPEFEVGEIVEMPCECETPDPHAEPVVEVVHDKDEEQTHTYTKPKVAKKWRRWEKLTYEQLLEEPIDKLRRYATKGLRIVAASKIPGGRLALVKRICEVR